MRFSTAGKLLAGLSVQGWTTSFVFHAAALGALVWGWKDVAPQLAGPLGQTSLAVSVADPDPGVMDEALEPQKDAPFAASALEEFETVPDEEPTEVTPIEVEPLAIMPEKAEPAPPQDIEPPRVTPDGLLSLLALAPNLEIKPQEDPPDKLSPPPKDEEKPKQAEVAADGKAEDGTLPQQTKEPQSIAQLPPKPPEPKEEQPVAKPSDVPIVSTDAPVVAGAAPSAKPSTATTPKPGDETLTSSPPSPGSVGSSKQADAIFDGNAPILYPPRAIEEGIEGTVLLRVRISADGRVTSVEIVSSSGSEILDTTAADGVRTWRGHPAHVGGRTVEAVALLPVKFQLH